MPWLHDVVVLAMGKPFRSGLPFIFSSRSTLKKVLLFHHEKGIITSKRHRLLVRVKY